jgi:hypothetical protein
MFIFFVYNIIFAFELYLLKSNEEGAEEFGMGMPNEGTTLALGYFIQAF